MKKLILSVILIGAIGGGYYFVSKNLRLSIEAFEGVKSRTKRGDLVVPITASGNIKPASVTQIKSKASGEVTDIPFGLGVRVKKDDLIIQLLDVDERRSMERATADHERGKIALATAQISLEQRKTTAVKMAEAKLAQTRARVISAMSKFEKFQPQTQPHDGLPALVTKEEWDAIWSAKLEADAAVLAAEAEVDQTQTAIKLAEQDVQTAKENMKATQAALNDALERLSETKIRSPIDGMILTRMVQVGEVVQSGKTMFTGGTVLMEIADISDIFAVVNVDEADIGMVRELAPAEARPGTASQPATLPSGTLDNDQVVKVTVESFPDEEFKGVITQISPQSEVVQAVATFKVWIRITSENREKLIGLLNTQAEAHFTARSVKDAVLVSYDAIQKNPNGEDYGVYVPELKPGALKATPKFVPCKLGADNGIDIEVRSGLDADQEVYVKLPQKTRQEEEAEDQKSDP